MMNLVAAVVDVTAAAVVAIMALAAADLHVAMHSLSQIGTQLQVVV